MKTFFLLSLFVFVSLLNEAQEFRFALITDTHIGGSTGADDLQSTIDDINSLKDIEFVILAGDVTEFGSGKELTDAKSILNKLAKPWYIVPGNHDSKWSESGNNDFVTIFGSEGFAFEKNGILFIGTASGPNMRMAPGLVPREQILFLERTLKSMKDTLQKVIFINHYPLDESLSNWYKVIDLLKKRNIQLSILGHGHANKIFNFEGITGVMCRSNLRAKETKGGYNLVTVKNDTVYFNEKNPGEIEKQAWHKIPLQNRNFRNDSTYWKRPDYSVNLKFQQVKYVWQFQDSSDVGTGISASGKTAVYSNTGGQIVAIGINSGNTIWKFKTGGKIYATPAISNNKVVAVSTDGNIYCCELKTGKVCWIFKTERPIVASPVIDTKTVFIGSSEGIFRAIDLETGNLKWQFNEVKGFVETRPLVYENTVFFGSWGNTFYALDSQTGNLKWKYEKYNNRMLSPAAVWPVASNGRIFIVAPDRKMTAINSKTGKVIWESGLFTCRESIGISKDEKEVYIKNMTEGHVMAFDTKSDEQETVWDCDAQLGYEIGPSPIVTNGRLVFVPTANGEIVAINKQSHKTEWRYKLSNALINAVNCTGKNKILVTSLDGKVALLKF